MDPVTLSPLHLVTLSGMALSNEQLEAIVARALPGDHLREARPLPDDRYALTLAGGERLTIQFFGSPEAAGAATAALRLLRTEVDLPIPQLRASDVEGSTIGRPYVLLGELTGEPLEQALGLIAEDQLYTLGRRLGEVVCRVHRIACKHYGALSGADPCAASDERGYVLARLEQDLRRCGELGLLDRRISGEVQEWFEQEFQPLGRQPALICAGLSPRTIFVRQGKERWWISALLRWEQACGWSPAWDHVSFFDTTDEPRFFSLRVGYGNGYDENTRRAYEQVREHVMLPYRMLLALQQMQEAYGRGAIEECERRRGVLRGMLRFLGT